jgi:hypothetical protein
MKYRPQLDDQQMRELAVLQMARQTSGEDMAAVLKQVRRGTTPEQIVGRSEPQAASTSAAPSARPGPAGPKHSKDRARVE